MYIETAGLGALSLRISRAAERMGEQGRNSLDVSPRLGRADRFEPLPSTTTNTYARVPASTAFLIPANIPFRIRIKALCPAAE